MFSKSAVIKYYSRFSLKACLHGGGRPQIGEVTCGGSPHLSCKRNDEIKMRDYIDRRVIPPKQVTSPTWGPPPPCKELLIHLDKTDTSVKWTRRVGPAFLYSIYLTLYKTDITRKRTHSAAVPYGARPSES